MRTLPKIVPVFLGLILGPEIAEGQEWPGVLPAPHLEPAVPSTKPRPVRLGRFQSPDAVPALVVADGYRWGYADELMVLIRNGLDPDMIATLEVLLPAMARARFGSCAAGGAIVIQMREGETLPEPVSAPTP